MNGIKERFLKKKVAECFYIEKMLYICTRKSEVRSVRLGVRTPDFHSGNTGSIPVRSTIIN